MAYTTADKWIIVTHTGEKNNIEAVYIRNTDNNRLLDLHILAL